MNYTLMHRNIAVADIEIDEETGTISKIADVMRPEHLPVGIELTGGRPNRKWLNDWWLGRGIPASRQGLRDALETLNISAPRLLLTKCFGLSLSDHYWLCPKSSAVEWNDVNFFENPFSEDVGNVLFGEKPDSAAISLLSPDNTSDGWLKKKWIIADGKRCLVKGGSGIVRQEPLNEVVAAEIMRRLDIPHVPYSIQWENDEPHSVCENFLTPQTELVSAWYIHQTSRRPNSVSHYDYYLNRCNELGIPNAELGINQMLVLDFLIANTDRHYSNFGAVRNAKTLEWLGIAPIYDSGTSMWHNTPNAMIGNDVQSKPFRSTHAEQIKLAASLDFVDFAKLKDIEDAANEIYRQSPLIDANRRERLCRSLAERVKLLEQERDSRAAAKTSLLGKLDSGKKRVDENRADEPEHQQSSGEHEI